MLMELVWYRMLAPLLGGSSYTFGLILAVALLGIGIGGGLYSRRTAPSGVRLFALTCTIEALAIGIPYALGDRLALLALLLRPLTKISFGGALLSWSLLACIVVLPAAIVSGFQFPAIIGLYGRGSRDVGRDVGRAYLANTLGAIAGSTGGGFGLLPLLGAQHCWILVIGMLLAAGLAAVVLESRAKGEGSLVRRLSPVALTAALGAATLVATGPTSMWRQSGIGAGRSDDIIMSGEIRPPGVESYERVWPATVRWQEDGLESAVALFQSEGFAFVVNGKVDGHVTLDAPTQVMSGVLAALIHGGEAKSAMVIGLGTGSTAGWLGALPGMDRVDVVELEPAILRVARDCAPINQHVMDNAKVHVRLGDARETLLTSRQSYDLIFSEPSNPYRAGISSLYTEEFYRRVEQRLSPDGIFAQWIQAYEVDGWAVSTAAVTIRKVFPSVSIWRTMSGDLLLIAQRETHVLDLAKTRERIKNDVYRSALEAAWHTSSVEGVLSHFVASPALADDLAANKLGAVNHDDSNVLEFAFARGVGQHRSVDEDFGALARRMQYDRPSVAGTFDAERVVEEHWLTDKPDRKFAVTPRLGMYYAFLDLSSRKQYAEALRTFRRFEREPFSALEASVVAEMAAHARDPEAEALIARVSRPAERELLRATWLHGQRKPEAAAESLEKAFAELGHEPWARTSLVEYGLALAERLGERSPALAPRLARALEAPFEVELFRAARLRARALLAARSQDAASCVRAVDALVPVPWDRKLFEVRASCYRNANDPRLPMAEAELVALLTKELPVGSSLVGPPRRREPRVPVPQALETDAGAGDASTESLPEPPPPDEQEGEPSSHSRPGMGGR
jgi:spermidine synthase